MDTIVSLLGGLLGNIMNPCYAIVRNYGIAIIIFTFFTKVILLPVSIMVHKNSIKMVKMQPEINFAKANYFGDKDQISEELLNLYKKYDYHPMLGLIPLAVQIVLLMGVIDVIYKPLKHIFKLSADVIYSATTRFSELSGISAEVNSIQISIADSLKKGLYIEELSPVLGVENIASVQALNMNFCGLNLAEVPGKIGGILILVPILAAFCAWLLCVTQNKVNVLQSEQGKLNKMGTMVLSVGLSLYLGFFVPAGVGVYWTFSNLFAILQLFFLNAVISPKKYIDYAALEESKLALEKKARRTKANRRLFEKDPYRSKEKHDYKAFYRLYNKQIVFYSEKNGFYKYFQNIIEYILSNTELVIHYVTNDPKDSVFEMENERFRVYYIGPRKIISFMMKMDANVVVMTTPDLEKYHIKRSLVRKDVEYVYLPHGVNSPNTSLRTGALDHYDIIFAQGPRAEMEIRAIEKLHGTKEKTIVPWGSSVIDNMIRNYDAAHAQSDTPGQNGMPGQGSESMQNGKLKQNSGVKQKTILIAPSWQEDNIIDTCIHAMLDELLKTGHHIILRPHPQFLRYAMDAIEDLRSTYGSYPDFELQTDFSSTSTVYEADLLITDWSGIAFEYSFATLKPTLSVNTPMKIMNPEWQKIEMEPIDIAIRTLIGKDIDVDKMDRISELADALLHSPDSYRIQIQKVRDEEVYNIGRSGEIGGQYIVDTARRVEENKADYLKYM